MVREAFVMKKLFLGLALSALISLPVLAALKEAIRRPISRLALHWRERNLIFL